MKLLVYLYEVMSWLKINFSKSEVILINGDEDKSLQMAELFNCQIGFFPSNTWESLLAVVGYMWKTGKRW
jgi:hypothetical protein